MEDFEELENKLSHKAPLIYNHVNQFSQTPKINPTQIPFPQPPFFPLTTQTLRQELEAARASGGLDKNDQIYVKNVKQGRDKYKTLKQIRQGNTKIRIETFESM